MKTLFVLMLVSSTAIALDTTPIVKQGDSCPMGYRGENGYCIPMNLGNSQTPKYIPKVNGCPTGYTGENGYCRPLWPNK